MTINSHNTHSDAREPARRIAGGETADRATGEEAEHWEEAETHNEDAVATTRLHATEGSSRADGGGRRQRTGDG